MPKSAFDRRPSVAVAQQDPGYVLRYWMHERERIRQRRLTSAEPSNWTTDPILRQYKFCNVFRHHDRVTVHYLQWINPLVRVGNKQDMVIFNTAMYRIFNWPMTMERIGLIRHPELWEPDKLKLMIDRVVRGGQKVFGGAYMITNAFHSIPKHELVFQALDTLIGRIDELVDAYETMRLEAFTKVLGKFFIFGPFLSYEVATDLTYNIMRKAKDTDTWANAGPGAKRGLNRLLGNPAAAAMTENVALGHMNDLLPELRKDWPSNWERLHLREIEHSLCEFDKYMRTLLGEGRPKARYIPAA